MQASCLRTSATVFMRVLQTRHFFDIADAQSRLHSPACCTSVNNCACQLVAASWLSQTHAQRASKRNYMGCATVDGVQARHSPTRSSRAVQTRSRSPTRPRSLTSGFVDANRRAPPTVGQLVGAPACADAALGAVLVGPMSSTAPLAEHVYAYLI